MNLRRFIAAGILSACLFCPTRSHADEVDASQEATSMLQGWDIFTFVLNTSSSPIDVSAQMAVYESPANYSLLIAPPAFADPDLGLVWKATLQPGQSTLITGRVKELVGSTDHAGVFSRFTGNNVNALTGGLQYFTVIMDAQGRLVQMMGPTTTNSTVPTPISAPNQYGDCYWRYPYSGEGFGTPISYGYQTHMVIRNGPQPNNMTVWVEYGETPAGSAWPFYAPCYALNLAANQVAVVDMTNNVVQFAHRAILRFSQSVAGGAGYVMSFSDDRGHVYETEDRLSYESAKGVVWMPNPTNFSPADTATNVSLQPIFAWTPPNSSTFPPGITQVGNYLLTVSSTTADPSQTGQVTNVPIDPATCGTTCSVPWPTTLLPSKLYYWRVTESGVGPIVPGPATGSNAGLPGIGGGSWQTGGTSALSFTTSP
jgi:hypothetical protein